MIGNDGQEVHFVGTIAFCAKCHKHIKMWREAHVVVTDYDEQDMELGHKVYHPDCLVETWASR